MTPMTGKLGLPTYQLGSWPGLWAGDVPSSSLSFSTGGLDLLTAWWLIPRVSTGRLSFYDLTSEVMYHHFCHACWSRQPPRPVQIHKEGTETTTLSSWGGGDRALFTRWYVVPRTAGREGLQSLKKYMQCITCSKLKVSVLGTNSSMSSSLATQTFLDLGPHRTTPPGTWVGRAGWVVCAGG